MVRGNGFESSVAASSAGVVARPGRAAWPLLQILCRQSTIPPSASRSASISIAIAAPNGACDISLSRDHCTRTGRPLAAFASRTASRASIVGGIVAIAASALEVFDRNIFKRQFEHQREIGAKKVDALAVGPDMDLIAGPLRHSAGGCDRPMRDIGAAVLPADRACPVRSAGHGFLVDDREFRRLGLQPLRQPVFIGESFAFRPRRALVQRLEGGFGTVFGFAHDADETSVAHDGEEAGYGPGILFLQAHEPRARDFRPQHATMQHAGQRGIVNETPMREYLVRNVESLHRMPRQCALRRRFRYGARLRLPIQRHLVRKLPVTGLNVAGPRQGSILDVEHVGPDAEAVRREIQKNLPHFGADMPQGASGLLHRKTARRDAFVRAARGCCAHHPHAADIDIEFVGGDLGERSHDALPDLHLAR